MKKHLYFSILIVAVIASVLLSCKKDNNKGECSGAPSISRVSTTLSRTDTSTAGSLADWIIIQGKNLCGTKQVDFNDISVDLKSAFITSNEITLRIPRSLPKEVNNKISITTNTGTAQYDYTVSIPALIVEGLNNEYTVQGGTIALLGKNFDLYGISETSGKVIFGDKEATIVRANSDTLFFKAPNGAAAGDKLKVIDQYGKEYGVPGRYRDPRGILHDFDPYAGWNSDLKISNGPVPSPISGNYANFEGDFVSWVWNTTFHAQRNFTFADLGVSGSLDNYVMRFEINVLKPMNNVPLLIELTQTGGDAFSFTYQQSFFGTTNGWKTISIPMSVFKKDGKTITITEAMAKAVTFNRTFIHTGENISLHFTLDNMRIVPKD